MIKLSVRPSTPSRLRGHTVGRKKATLTRKSKQGIPISQSDFDREYYSHLDIRRVLWEWQNRKCCYCERHRDLKREPDVEHFRPKAGVDDEVHAGYWWLAYEWENLFFSCKTCNQAHKKNAFPLETGGIRAALPTDDLSLESPTLVDLANDDPESLIGYYWEDDVIPLAKPVNRDPAGRGHRVISILGLDRDELNIERGQLIPSLKAQAEACHLAIRLNNTEDRGRQVERLRSMTAKKQPFLAFRKFFFRQSGLGDFLCDG